MEDEYCYLYCVARPVSEEALSGVTGHLGRQVSKVISGDLMALISPVPSTSLEVTLENLSRHESVISALMEKTGVLPMSFSTVLRFPDEVAELLEKYRNQFEAQLGKVEGKAELGLKVFYKLDLKREDRMPAEGQKPGEYMMARYRAYREEQEKLRGVFQCVEELHRELTERSAESCFTKPLKNNLIFNASYLVSKEETTSFRRLIEQAQEAHRDYRFSFSGPWPAYHFVKIIREGETK